MDNLLRSTPFQPDKLETIDCLLGEFMHNAESHCMHRFNDPFSSKIKNLCIKRNILRIHCHSLKSGKNMDSVILNLQRKLDSPIPLPTNIKDTKGSLQEKRTIRNAHIERQNYLATHLRN